MSSYKDLLRERLQEFGWELQSVDQEGIDWWAAELWHIRSTRQAWGLQLVLSFLVDPWEESGQVRIWAISATKDVPADRYAASEGIAVLSMSKRHFGAKLVEFVNGLENYRNAQPS